MEKSMSVLDKIEAAIQTPAYKAYCNLMGAAIARAAMGDPTARDELLDLQREQEQLVRDAVDATP
jgi:hypothetical protein